MCAIPLGIVKGLTQKGNGPHRGNGIVLGRGALVKRVMVGHLGIDDQIVFRILAQGHQGSGSPRNSIPSDGRHGTKSLGPPFGGKLFVHGKVFGTVVLRFYGLVGIVGSLGIGLYLFPTENRVPEWGTFYLGLPIFPEHVYKRGIDITSAEIDFQIAFGYLVPGLYRNDLTVLDDQHRILQNLRRGRDDGRMGKDHPVRARVQDIVFGKGLLCE